MNPIFVQFGQELLKASLPMIGTLVGSLLSYLLYYLTGLIKSQTLQDETRKAVAYAEQKLVDNKDKLAYVETFLQARTGGKLSQQDMAHLIEAAVLALPNTHPNESKN